LHSIVARYDNAVTPNSSVSTLVVAVTPAPLTITASGGTITYGAAVPPVTPTFQGFVNGDGPGSLTTAPTCAAAARAPAAVGTYATTCSGAVDPNYTITYVAGSLAVTPAPLTITASTAAGASKARSE
jgi:hypothetical protein